MPSNPILFSLLDTDFYKFTMMQCIYHHFPRTPVGYRLILRKPVDLRPFRSMLEEQIHSLCQLKLQKNEENYLRTLGYFKNDFLDTLATFSLSEKNINIEEDPQGLILKIEGTWEETILFEVPLLAIISEVYYRQTIPSPDYSEGRKRLRAKIDYLKQEAPHLPFSDFGTRRRFSHTWQQEVITTLMNAFPDTFLGTSNVYFAKLLGLRPIGTMAHEYLQACQVLAPQIKGSQHFALQTWLKEYPHDLGIALTDSLTMDVFLSEFDRSLATHYQGLRQDSGDPIAWGEKALAHYRALGIDPKNKIFVFSDNLNVSIAVNIFQHFDGYCRPVFGIGTNLTNDLGYPPLDMVLKMVHTHHQPVIKITDSPGKTVCENAAYLKKIKTLFDIKDPPCA